MLQSHAELACGLSVEFVFMAEPLAHLEIRIVWRVVHFDAAVVGEFLPLTLDQCAVGFEGSLGASGMREACFDVASAWCFEEEQNGGRA